MTDDRQRRAEELFQEILDLPAQDRHAHLTAVTADDPSLRHEVEILLQHFAAASPDFLAVAPQLIRRAPVPKSIGGYQIERILGEGGMGTVYLAHQDKPLRRSVALKVMAFGTHHRTLTARFLAERQMLARLSHPSVAQVFDAGTTDSGELFFVMEFVDGESLHAYCDRHTLDVENRLELFLKVCAGVEHAHQRGIIHRDLKPANVLVADTESEPIPKIIDFGIAKDIDDDDQSRLTATGWIGTPEYMSPEQAAGQEIDTRSDIYALGMLLYELIAGVLPHTKSARTHSAVERLHAATTTDFTRPSLRFGQAENALELAKRRRSDIASLTRRLRTDLDWVVLKAIEKDADRRYPSVGSLTADLERSLRREPVQARPPELSYVVRQLARRRPGVAVAVLSSVVFLVGFVSLLLIQNHRVQAERARAENEAAVANQVADFLTDMFRQSNPRQGHIESVEDLLAIGVERIEALDDLPQIQGRLLITMGTTHVEMGLLDQAEDLLRRGIAGETNEIQKLNGRDQLAALFMWQGRLAEAESLQVYALEERDRLLGSNHKSSADGLNNLGVIYQNQNRLDDAADAYERALSVWSAPDTDWGQGEAVMLNNLATVDIARRNYARAESLLSEVIPVRETRLGADHIETLDSRSNLALVYSYTDRLDQALTVWGEVLPLERDILGPTHPTVLRNANNYASALSSAGRIAHADSVLTAILATAPEHLGPRHPGRLAALGNLGAVRSRQGRYDEALGMFQRLLEVSTDVRGAEHPSTVNAMHNVGVQMRRVGRYVESYETLLRAEALRRELLGESDPSYLRTLSSLGLVLEKLERWHEASRQHRLAYDGRASALGASHPSTRSSLRNLIRSLVQSGDRQEALQLATEGVDQGLDIARLLEDPLMLPVQSDPEFLDILPD